MNNSDPAIVSVLVETPAARPPQTGRFAPVGLSVLHTGEVDNTSNDNDGTNYKQHNDA